MQPYRVKEIRIVDGGVAGPETKTLREYERPSADRSEVVEQVRRFFEIEMSSPRALQTVDFDAIVVIDPEGAEIARFSVADFWIREWRDVAFGVAERGSGHGGRTPVST
ncbi:MAG: hypothetical protein EKK29_12485 [Hyphomicrobiales bacterium]|nr:MAG: hypothetical protein EKK29_12485 [Hyphomicrobiales bacterium]